MPTRRTTACELMHRVPGPTRLVLVVALVSLLSLATSAQVAGPAQPAEHAAQAGHATAETTIDFGAELNKWREGRFEALMVADGRSVASAKTWFNLFRQVQPAASQA